MLQPNVSDGNIIKPGQLIADKIPIAPVGGMPINQAHTRSESQMRKKKVAGKSSRKPRVEHVVIEKRYRMKLTSSLNTLKDRLNCHSEKKVGLCPRLFWFI